MKNCPKKQRVFWLRQPEFFASTLRFLFDAISFLQKEINHRTINHTNSPNNSAITWDTCPVFMISCFFSLLVIICPFYHVPRFFSAQHVSTIDSTWIPRTFPEHSTFGAAVPAKWCSTLPPAPECFDPAW